MGSGGGSWKVGREEAAGRRAVRGWGGCMVGGGGVVSEGE